MLLPAPGLNAVTIEEDDPTKDTDFRKKTVHIYFHVFYTVADNACWLYSRSTILPSLDFLVGIEYNSAFIARLLSSVFNRIQLELAR